jgi:hypothetical protein
MKKLLFMLFSALCVATVLVSCSSDDDNGSVSNDMRINGKAVSRTADEAHLSPLEIAKQGVSMNYYSDDLNRLDNLTFQEDMRDTTAEHPALLVANHFVVRGGFELVTGCINIHDAVIVRAYRLDENKDTIWYKPNEGWHNGQYDTIAYVPNKVVREAYKNIKAAWDAGDKERVYKLFHDALTFTPINAKEWKELKARGEQ